MLLQVLPSLSDKTIHQNHEVTKGQNVIFFLICILEFCLIIFGMWFCKRNISYFSLWVNFFAFPIHMYVPFLFFACVCRSCYDQGLPHNAILQRHVYMTISDLPHSNTHLSKLSHHHECRPTHCKDFH